METVPGTVEELEKFHVVSQSSWLLELYTSRCVCIPTMAIGTIPRVIHPDKGEEETSL